MNYKAPAKLNLFLHITKRRPDGYHELQTLFQLIDYCDELSFKVRSDKQINVSSNADIQPQDNLVFKAAHLLQKQCRISQGVDIYLRKRIPIGAGLGGGSSDAATTLRVLNRLWNCRLDGTQLAAYGKDLGADVSFFVGGHSAWGEGIGDLLQAVDLPSRWYAVFIPPQATNTRAMYQCSELKRDCADVSMQDYLSGRTNNVFEAIVRNKYPQIAAAIDGLNKYQAVCLTGSGSAFFATCKSKQQARQLCENAPANLQSLVVRGINESPLLNETSDLC